jgi:hypothetical protein
MTEIEQALLATVKELRAEVERRKIDIEKWRELDRHKTAALGQLEAEVERLRNELARAAIGQKVS